MKWRLVTHEHMRASADEIDSRWSTDDVIEAHTVLDEIEQQIKEARRDG